MQLVRFLAGIYFCSILFSCSVTNKNYDPIKKFSQQQLQHDYSLLRDILEKKHPALYWYTPRESMNYYFDSLYKTIADSMTEQQFAWKILAPLTHQVRCGHTSFRMSKNWLKFINDKQVPSFPLRLKIWGDTMVVTSSLNTKAPLLQRGTFITAINGVNNHQLIQQMLRYLPLDGYAENVNYIRLSSNFGGYHRNIFGMYKNYRIGYIDSTGNEKLVVLPIYHPAADSTKNKSKTVNKQPFVSRKKNKKERVLNDRSLEIDSAGNIATMILNTFSNGHGAHLNKFFKQSFKKISEQHIKNLILDLRSNGGGDVKMYVKLTRYLRDSKFKVADTCYAIAKNLSPYSRYIKQGFFNNLALLFLTKKKGDGLFHFGYWERHNYYPARVNHFNDKLYVLTNGPTFSASTLFCNAVKGQPNITIVGEETGGGWHGNSGIMIPDITLPNTKLRVRLPLFKIVQFNHVPHDGRGVFPDIFIPPTLEGIKQNIDIKMRAVKEMILKGNIKQQQ